MIFPSYGYFPRSKFKKVDFPFPFLPINPSFQLVSMEKETSSKILSKLPSSAYVNCFTFISDIMPPLCLDFLNKRGAFGSQNKKSEPILHAKQTRSHTLFPKHTKRE